MGSLSLSPQLRGAQSSGELGESRSKLQLYGLVILSEVAYNNNNKMPVSRKLSSANFLRQFRDAESRELNKLSAVQFMEVWDHYDSDENGFIEDEELDGFLREFVSSVHANEDVEVTQETLADLKACFMEAYDDNKDGKIDIREVDRSVSKSISVNHLFSLHNCSQWRKTFYFYFASIIL